VARRDETGFVGDHALGPVAGVQLREDPADVCLRRERRDGQPRRDLGVGVTSGDLDQDVALSLGEGAEHVVAAIGIVPRRELVDQSSGDAGCDQDVAVARALPDGADRSASGECLLVPMTLLPARRC